MYALDTLSLVIQLLMDVRGLLGDRVKVDGKTQEVKTGCETEEMENLVGEKMKMWGQRDRTRGNETGRVSKKRKKMVKERT